MAKEIWIDSGTYSQKILSARFYELSWEILQFWQGDVSFDDYFATIHGNWNAVWVVWMNVFFLVCANKEWEVIQVHQIFYILSWEFYPSLSAAFSLLHLSMNSLYFVNIHSFGLYLHRQRCQDSCRKDCPLKKENCYFREVSNWLSKPETISGKGCNIFLNTITIVLWWLHLLEAMEHILLMVQSIGTYS